MGPLDLIPLFLLFVFWSPQALADVNCSYIDSLGQYRTKTCVTTCCDSPHQDLCCAPKDLVWIAIVGVFSFIFVAAVIVVIIHCCFVRRHNSYHLIKTDMGNQQPAGRVEVDVEPFYPDDTEPYPAEHVVHVMPDVQPYYPAGQVDPYYNPDLQPYNPNSEPYNPNTEPYNLNTEPFNPHTELFNPNTEPYNPQPDIEPYNPQPDVSPYTPDVAPYYGNTEPYNDNAPYRGYYDPAGMVGPYGGDTSPMAMIRNPTVGNQLVTRAATLDHMAVNRPVMREMTIALIKYEILNHTIC